MLILWICAGAAAFYFLQTWIYARFWKKGLSARLYFSRESATEGEECCLVEQVENGKLLPLPVLKVKFQVSRKLHFSGEGDSAVSDQYYRNDILSMGPRQRVMRRIPFRCAARGYYRINGLDLVCSDLFLGNEMVEELEENSSLYVYPAPVGGFELDRALQKLNGEILAKRHLLEDPFEYRGIWEYAPFDERKAINWKATARMGTLMVNMRNYTSLQAVRIFLNLEDNGIWRQEELVELCIRIAARIAQMLLGQGIRVAVYCNAKDILTGRPMRLPPSSGAGQMESINRALARLNLEEEVDGFAHLFAKELEDGRKEMMSVFLSVDRSAAFQNLLETYLASGAEGIWMCPLLPRMESEVEKPEKLHFIRLNAEELLNGA